MSSSHWTLVWKCKTRCCNERRVLNFLWDSCDIPQVGNICKRHTSTGPICGVSLLWRGLHELFDLVWPEQWFAARWADKPGPPTSAVIGEEVELPREVVQVPDPNPNPTLVSDDEHDYQHLKVNPLGLGQDGRPFVATVSRSMRSCSLALNSWSLRVSSSYSWITKLNKDVSIKSKSHE